MFTTAGSTRSARSAKSGTSGAALRPAGAQAASGSSGAASSRAVAARPSLRRGSGAEGRMAILDGGGGDGSGVGSILGGCMRRFNSLASSSSRSGANHWMGFAGSGVWGKQGGWRLPGQRCWNCRP